MRPTLPVRAGLVWVLLLLLAIGNGALRQGWLLPRLPDIRAHQVSTLLLAALILAATRVTTGWLAVPGRRAAWAVGAAWVALLLAFEFLAGHFLFGRTWTSLLAEYESTEGRVWVFIPIVTLIAPVLWAGRGRPH